jgi:lysophospholipase L1-like esterase
MMDKLLIFIMAVICAGILVFGHIHWKNMSIAASLEMKTATEVLLTKEKEEKEALINKLKPNSNKPQSLLDFLHYRALKQKTVSLSVLGSNVTAGNGASRSSNSWSELLKRKLQSENKDLKSLKLINHGYEGYSTTDLVNGNKAEEVIKDHPDLVLFENSIVNNHLQSISIEQTKKDLESIMSAIQKGMPDAKIFIMPPNLTANMENKNSLGLNYLDYIKASEEVIAEKKWPYINSIEEIEKRLKEEDILLVDILANDYINPNDKGNYLWFDFLYDFLKKQ